MSTYLARWRIEKAERAYADGKRLQEAGSYEGAVNRYYYAAFHAAKALLATRGLDASKHKGVISLFNREFVKPGTVSKAASKTLSACFLKRSKADYDDFATISRDEAEVIQAGVRSLIDEVARLIIGSVI